MKAIVMSGLFALVATGAVAQNYRPYGTGSNPNSHYVQPHYNPSSGSYNSGYYRTNPNSYGGDNYGAQGNYNPYTGRTTPYRR